MPGMRTPHRGRFSQHEPPALGVYREHPSAQARTSGLQPKSHEWLTIVLCLSPREARGKFWYRTGIANGASYPQDGCRGCGAHPPERQKTAISSCANLADRCPPKAEVRGVVNFLAAQFAPAIPKAHRSLQFDSARPRSLGAHWGYQGAKTRFPNRRLICPSTRSA